jgi:hydrogenase/urease accessory protein HupE
MMKRLLIGLLALLLATGAGADVFRPAYLELREAGNGEYEVMWKVPVLGEELRLSAYVVFPEGTERLVKPRVVTSGGAWIESWRVRREGGLAGETIAIEGNAAGVTDVIARVERLDGTSQVERLQPGAPRFVVLPPTGTAEVAWSYLVLGVEHILGGIDHLLFVLALLLLVSGSLRIVATITAFTAAHTITLVAATFGWVHVPGPPVEAIIALSIVFVASEVVHGLRGENGLTTRAPWVVAFGFGLLHGLGFAGALAEVGLPQKAIPLALLMFNVGVELGQLAFVAAVLTAGTLLGRAVTVRSEQTTAAIAYGIGAVAACWTLERVASFWP